MTLDEESNYVLNTLICLRAESSQPIQFSGLGEERGHRDASYTRRHSVTAGTKTDLVAIRQFFHILPGD